MGDAADILGVQKTKPVTNNPLSIMTGTDKAAVQVKAEKKRKPKGMSRELFNLMGKDGIAPSVQTNTDTKNAGFKNKRLSNTQGKWVWTEYHSSARSDSQPFSHWVKADLQAFDYVYAKFNTKMDPITYTNDEYESLLKVPSWTRSETDAFMYICHEFNLRWPVIADRFESTSHRSTEDLMARYYSIATKIKSHRNEKRGGSFASQAAPAACFDVEFERCRRKQQELLFQMTPEDRAEEVALREELKSLDASIKKIKKSLKQAPPPPPAASTGVNPAAATTTSKKKSSQKEHASAAPLATSTAASIAAASVGGSVAAAVLLKAMPPIVMYGGVMTPAPGQPCLQSARLAFTSDLPDFSKKVVTGFEGTANLDLSEPFIAKLKHYSQEVGMPDKLLPTRAVCDLNDQIRRDMAILLSLQGKIASNEEKITAFRELNPNINAAAYGNVAAAKGPSIGPECRFGVPDATFLVKDSDSAGHSLPVLKSYVPAAPHLLVPPPPVSVEKAGAADKEKGGSSSGTKAGKSSAGSGGGSGNTESTGKPTKKSAKSKRKASDISKDVASPTSSASTKQSFVAPDAKTKTKPSAAATKPPVKKINPVLAKAATIPILPLNNTPESIAFAAAANAEKAKLLAEQRAASEDSASQLPEHQPALVDSSAPSSTTVASTRAISAAVNAVAPSVSTRNNTSTTAPSPSTATANSASLDVSSTSASTASSSAAQLRSQSESSQPQPQLPSQAPAGSAIAMSSTSMTPSVVSQKRGAAGEQATDSSEPSLKKAKPN